MKILLNFLVPLTYCSFDNFFWEDNQEEENLIKTKPWWGLFATEDTVANTISRHYV